MKKTVFILIGCLSVIPRLFGQPDTSWSRSGNTIVAGIHVPFGEFSETHIAGISLSYAWSNNRFGKLKALPKKLIGFTADAGIDFYLGKKEKVAGYDFKNGSYISLAILGGAIYSPCKRGNIRLTAGPALGIYKGNADLGFGVNLDGSYYLNTRIAITPGLIYLKHKEANALWAASVRASYNF
jgi:hypothetical protein